MKFSCDQCQAQYMIADEKVGPKGVKVRCKKCGNIISVAREEAAAAQQEKTTVQQQAPGSAFDDLFGQNAAAGAGEEERAPTKVFTTQELNRVREEQALAKGGDNGAGSNGAGDNGAGGFGASFGGGEAAAAAPASAPAEQAAPAAATMARAEWYVAINDEQVGPITDADVAQRWDRGDLTAASLAWKAGLPDWAPISGLAELQHLVSRPQASQLRAAAAPTPTPEPQVEEKKEVVTWRPSGASALADLAKEAVVEEPKRPEPQPDASPFGNDFQPQTAGGGDPFGAPAFAGSSSGPSTVWQFPSTASKKSSGIPKWVLAAGGVFAVFIIGIVGVLAYTVIQQPKQQVQYVPVAPTGAPVVTPPPIAPSGAIAMAGTGTVAPTGAVAATGSVATPPPNNGLQTPPVPGKGKKGKKDKNDKPGEETAAADPPKKEEKKKPDDDGGFGDLLNGKKKNADVKATLSRDDVLGTVKSNSGTITKCADAYARSGGKLPPKLVARWVIKPSGNTESAEMASPELKGTPVDACVVAAIKKWKFPEFQNGTIPVTFPFVIPQ
ncbi:MAG: zinc-ribbon domain-containing protein [Deltaproteobacteria bacterium]|nr:zinc-ribbon domain-containing protein [Deltaproteobacteria bacterium]